MKLKACAIHACTNQDEHCTTEQYLSVDTQKKKILNNREDCRMEETVSVCK